MWTLLPLECHLIPWSSASPSSRCMDFLKQRAFILIFALFFLLCFRSLLYSFLSLKCLCLDLFILEFFSPSRSQVKCYLFFQSIYNDLTLTSVIRAYMLIHNYVYNFVYLPTCFSPYMLPLSYCYIWVLSSSSLSLPISPNLKKLEKTI